MASRMEEAKKLAEAHWSYVESVIRAEWAAFETVGVDTSNIEGHLAVLKHHYITAMVHGYKHGYDDATVLSFPPSPDLPDLS